MNTKSPPSRRKGISLSAILRARCPGCHQGKVLEGIFTIRPLCTHCGYDFYPEPGFYMGAMAVGFLLTAILTVPPMIILKLMNVEMNLLLVFPFIEFFFIGTFLIFYSRILWLHLEYRMTDRLDGHSH